MQVKSSISCFSFGVGGRCVVRRPLLIDPNPYTTPRNRRNTSLLISDAQPKHVCRCRADENKSPKLSSLDKGHQFPSSECVEWAWLPVLPHVLTASISNFLFGYHIGIMNGPIRSIAHELGFEGESITEGLVVSIFVAAAFIGSLSTGTLADMIGRRRTLQLDMLPFILGTLISANANTVNEMLFGRFLVGLGIGANTVLVPVYISEVAPRKYRGSMGSVCQLATCLGLIMALVVGLPCESDSHWWRTLFCIGSIPAFMALIGLQFSVESPRWLGKMRKWDEVKKVILSLWGQSEVESTLNDLQGTNDSSEGTMDAQWSELRQKHYFKAPVIGGILFILQQFSGINGVLYFSSLTFTDVGISDSLTASVAVGIANFSGSAIALYLMDKQGRRDLLRGSYIGMAIAMFLVVFSLVAAIDEKIRNTLSVFGTLMYVFTFSLGAGPVTGIIIPELSTTRIRAKTMSFSLCVHWVCNFVIGLFFLDAVDKFGLPAIYSSFGVVSLMAAAFSNYFIIETKGRGLEEIEMLLNPDLEKRS